MAETKPKILFMGTPEFAVPSLEALIAEGFNLTGVVTQPDRPKGRGRKEAPSPVKESALRHSLPVIQPESARDELFLRNFYLIGADLVALVAFGQILPREMVEFPRFGIINVHPSLLPKYRGAAPINWALIRGEEVTGVTTMRIGVGVDTGDIYLQEQTPIRPEEDFGSLHDRLADIGARLLVSTINGLLSCSISAISQDSVKATLAPRIMKEDCRISWNSHPHRIVNLVRGLSPVPGAFTYFQGKYLKILSAACAQGLPEIEPGTVAGETEGGLLVAASHGYVELRDVQLEGKRRMSIKEFARGHRLLGEVLK